MATIGLERLADLLDAYGADAERWPPAEREAARQLVERSGAARALWEEAATLDSLLDSVPAGPASAALAASVLAGAPRRRRAVAWRRALVAAVPLAAAAAVVLWLVTGQHAGRDAGSRTVIALGEYTSPTDVLLEPYGVDVYATVPAVGCADSVLGCPKVENGGTPYSERSAARWRA